MYEKELFANYELDNSNWNKIILGMAGGSIVFHVIIFLFLIYVPAVRDAFYVAMLFSDAPTGWVSKDYNKTEIAEGDTASIINLPPSDQLQYPEGYFNLANGDAPSPDMIAMTTPYAPEIVGTYDNSVSEYPDLNFDQPVDEPTPFPTPAPIESLPVTPNNSRSKLPKLKRVPKNAKLPEFSGVTEPSPEPSPANGSLNSKPLEDLAAKAIKKLNDKEIDLAKTVNVTIKGVLDDKGKLIAKQTTYKNNGGDEQLAVMAVELINAMNDSNMLTYAKELSSGSTKRDVVFNISKDDKEVKFQVISDVGDSKQADKIQSTLSLGIGLILMAKNGTEEGDLLKGIKIGTDKNQVVINWLMDTPTAMRKIQNKLDKIAAEQKAKSASTPAANSNSQAAVK